MCSVQTEKHTNVKDGEAQQLKSQKLVGHLSQNSQKFENIFLTATSALKTSNVSRSVGLSPFAQNDLIFLNDLNNWPLKPFGASDHTFNKKWHLTKHFMVVLH